MIGFGGVVSFEVASDLQGVIRFIDALEIPFIATSLGGCESLVQQPAVMSFWYVRHVIIGLFMFAVHRCTVHDRIF
jgi:cystathionine beta-lyase/cystathionine gamma-synthase